MPSRQQQQQTNQKSVLGGNQSDNNTAIRPTTDGRHQYYILEKEAADIDAA